MRDALDELIEMSRALGDPAREYVILGEGKERTKLDGLTRELGLWEHVDMPGFVMNPYKYMARAAVFALSSTCEGFSNVLLEAIACGCSTVSTDCPTGPTEILDGGKYGWLVPVGDFASLGEMMTMTLLLL